MIFDTIIVGQGIAGTVLSFLLMQKGQKVLVIDNASPARASLHAGGVMHAYRARTWKQQADAQHKLDVALSIYSAMQDYLRKPLIAEKSMLVWNENFPDANFEKANNNLSSGFTDLQNAFVAPNVFVVNTSLLIGNWRHFLQTKDALLEDQFDFEKLVITKAGVQYGELRADRIIFCEGIAAQENPFFNHLKFIPNKGNVLLLKIGNLPQENIYEDKIRLIPLGDEIFWCGSNHEWNPTNAEPDIEWRKEVENHLQHWLKLDYEVVNHICAIRPTTPGQQPYVGFHADYSQLGIFNGFGTKGFLWTPFYASEFIKKIIDK